MDQITQGASSPQPGPQQIPPAVTPQTQISPVSVPQTSNPTPGISGTPSKLKNPKLWIGAGALLLIVVVGAAIFLGKPPLFPGKSQLPGIPTLQPGSRPAGEGGADICAKLNEQKCAKAAERGICAWTDGKCTAVGGAVAPVGTEVKAPGGIPAVIGPVVPGGGKEPPAEPPPAAEALPPPPTPAADPLEQLRDAKLESAQDLVEEACNAAREAKNKAQEFGNVPDVQTAANQAETACQAATAAVVQLKKAATVDEINRLTNAAQNARNEAVAARDNAIATAEAAANEAANAAAAARREFEEFCKTNNLEWKDNQCIFNGTPYNNRQGLEVALAAAAAGDEDQKKKDCEDKNKDKDPKTPEWRWNGKECVGGKVAVADIKECLQGTILYEKNGKKECRAQDELCPELAGGLTSVLNKGQLEPGEVPEAVDELNSLTENRCGFTAAQFLAPFEEEKAKNACAAKDQDVWEWDAGGKICKNKQEGRILELESLVASLQGQLANAQGSNSDAQINALAQQIATLNSQINELRGAAGEPIVITVVAPPAPAPAPAPAAPPAAPPSGGGGGEIVAVATPEVKKEEKKDSKKKKDKKATSGTASVETAAASAPAVSDSGAAAGVVAVQPAATGTAAAGSAGSAPATSAAASTRVTHGAFIQGRTGPGVLIYPLAVIGANGVWYVLRKRRKK